MNSILDLEHLRGWIGREDVQSQVLTPDVLRQFNATFGKDRTGDVAPALIHFCLNQPAVSMDGLGADGHPAKGGFLPPVPLPRRMWAGGALDLLGPIRVGEEVMRRSVIKDVTAKEGRSGTLCFVTVAHEVTSGGRQVIRERQDIVYRGEGSSAPVAASKPDPAPVGAHVDSVMPSTTLLFRYSALTFNGHRIHYDREYATQVEGYPGLVVHGPMQATMLCHFAERIWGSPPEHFRFRGLAPAFDGTELTLNAEQSEQGLRLWTAPRGGAISMEAFATW